MGFCHRTESDLFLFLFIQSLIVPGKLFFSGCQLGTYGETCNQTCPLNCASECHVESGNCDSCTPGYYGDKCNANCSVGCLYSSCAKGSGNCLRGCKAGYSGIKCHPCEKGRFGQNCERSCPNGCLNDECDSVNWTCSACKYGYSGPSCRACTLGRYGRYCNKSCSDNCGGDGSCDINTGICAVCKPGYYGQSCSFQCSKNCFDSNSCERKQGACIGGCIQDWVDDKCDQKCHFDNCEECGSGAIGPYCRRCMKGWIPYNSGCKRCTANCTAYYSTSSCTECVPGNEGRRCSEQCNANCRNKTCDVIGNCHDGCNPGYFGSECNSRCSDKCTGGYTQCDDETGQCTEGCMNRAYGVQCNTPCSSNCKLCTSLQCEVCDDGYFGFGSLCAKCRFNCVKCTGFNDCTLCVDGFHGSTCSECPTHCDSCTNSTFCPSCEAGWAGEICKCNLNCSDQCGIDGRCNLGCVEGLYGISCGLRCKATDCLSCNQTTGNCTQCVAGKYGESCEKTCHSNCAMDECEIGGACVHGCKAGFTGSTCIEGKIFYISIE